MKKMMMMLAVAAIALPAMAQTNGWNQNSNYGYGNNGGNYEYRGNGRNDGNRYGYDYSRRELDMKIARINREYDDRIWRVRNNFFMPQRRKERIIYDLEQQRRNEIRRVYDQFSNRDNQCGDGGGRRHF